jgi:RNA polymerase sigma-70 factor (ECF subfamily)
MNLTDDTFSELMTRVRAGDQRAAEQLIRDCEADIRLEIRVRLRIQDSRVRRLLDSMDIAQSVLASFFAGVAEDKLSPQSPRQLFALLLSMARNKLLKKVRYHRQKRRDARRLLPIADLGAAVPTPAETPSEYVAGKELLATLWARLTPRERLLSEQRREGRSWEAIAADLGGTPHGLRKQLERAFARVSQDLNLAAPQVAVAGPR